MFLRIQIKGSLSVKHSPAHFFKPKGLGTSQKPKMLLHGMTRDKHFRCVWQHRLCLLIFQSFSFLRLQNFTFEIPQNSESWFFYFSWKSPSLILQHYLSKCTDLKKDFFDFGLKQIGSISSLWKIYRNFTNGVSPFAKNLYVVKWEG